MILSTISKSESIYASFKFVTKFFTNFVNSEQGFQCKLIAKPFGNVFRMNLENMSTVIIQTRNDRVLVEINCIKDVQKLHSFQYEESRTKVIID